MLTTFERRQRILALLRERAPVKINELAEQLKVSKVTIRNDLAALEKDSALSRVRGGAVPRDEYKPHSPSFAARAQVNALAKHGIARWAADMVHDGETIVLDASTTVFYMVPYLLQARRLTIITNSIEVALALVKNPTHTVILVGGELSTSGAYVRGHLAESNLEQLHARLAFVSCSGFTLQEGLMHPDIQEARLKGYMVRAAERVVALIDSSKFGKRDLTSFATTSQLAHIFTDSGLPQQHIEPLRLAGISVTVCGENSVATYSPLDKARAHYKIGFTNISEDASGFGIEVRHGLEAAAQRAGNIGLVFADNQLSSEVALAVADQLVREKVDLVIEYQIDEKTGVSIADKFNQAGIPVIAVDIPIIGATFFGVDNYRAGHMAGVALGEWVQKHWHGVCDGLVVLEEPRAGALAAARIQGQLDGLRSVIGNGLPERLLYLDGGSMSDAWEERMATLLRDSPNAHRLAVLCFNDRATVAALNAARRCGRESDIIVVGQGADWRIREEIRQPGSRIIGATAFWPERYGDKLIDIALRLLRGEQVPPAVYIEHVFINAENIAEYYPN